MSSQYSSSSSPLVSTPTRHDTTDTTSHREQAGMSLRDVARELGQQLNTIDRLYHDVNDGGDE